MKNRNLFYILFSMTSFFFFIACEKTGLQTTSNEMISPRSWECSSCPLGDCCCAFEILTSNATVTFTLCNTTNGIGLCTGGSSGACSVSNNGGQHFTLSPTHTKHGFCVNPGDAFWIKNTHPTIPVQIRLTCEEDDISPQSVTITIPADTAYYFDTDNDCQVSSCQ